MIGFETGGIDQTLLLRFLIATLWRASVTRSPVFNRVAKRLELMLMRLQASGPGYEESKPLARFIWEVYAGWNWIDGDVGGDRIQKVISNL